MSASELRDSVREQTTRDLLGEDWRIELLNFGGLIGQMFDQIKRGEDPKRTMGLIDGKLQALDIINDAVKKMNG